MATKTIDLLLSLEVSKPKAIDDLTSRFKTLENRADTLRRGIADIESKTWLGKSGDVMKNRVDGLKKSLDKVTREIGDINREANKRTLERNLKNAETQANRTREKMEKLAQVGNRLAVAGALILTPLTLALKKYAETLKADDPMKKRIDNLTAKFTEFQTRIGKLVADTVIPLAERIIPYIDKVISFIEAHPDLVKVALGAGTILVVAGGIMSTVASVVSTIATVQGLAAGLGIGGTAAVGGAAAGLGASIASAIAAAAPFVAIAVAVAAAAELTRQIMNWALGTDTTWADIGNTLKQLLVLMGEGWDRLLSFFGVESNFSKTIADALKIADIQTNQQTSQFAKQQRESTNGLATTMRGGFEIMGGNLLGGFNSIGTGFNQLAASLLNIFRGGQADGGYANSAGMYMRGEAGREFVLNNSTTRAAESMIGGRLSQDNVLGAMRSVRYYDARRYEATPSLAQRRMIVDDTLNALSSGW